MQCVYKLNFTSSQTQYALVQCFPDLLPEECKSCLTQSMTQFNFSRVGGRVLFPSYNSRYEIYPFYEETFVATLPPSPLITYPPLPLVTAPSLPWLQLLHCRLVKTSLYLFFHLLPVETFKTWEVMCHVWYITLAGKERNSTVIILATGVPVAVFVLFLVAVLSCQETKRVKKADDTTVAYDGNDSIFCVCSA